MVLCHGVVLALNKFYIDSIELPGHYAQGHPGAKFGLSVEEPPQGGVVGSPGKLPIEEIDGEVGDILDDDEELALGGGIFAFGIVQGHRVEPEGRTHMYRWTL